MFEDVAEMLRRFDAKPTAMVEEAVPCQLLWSALAYLPGTAERLGVPEGLYWYRGGRGVGDLTGRRDMNEPVLAHVEVKSAGAKISYGRACPNHCGHWVSQLQHMAHDRGAIIVVITHTSRVTPLRAMIADDGLAQRVTVISFTTVADAVAACVAAGNDPGGSLLASLLDVELVQGLPLSEGSGIPDSKAG